MPRARSSKLGASTLRDIGKLIGRPEGLNTLASALNTTPSALDGSLPADGGSGTATSSSSRAAVDPGFGAAEGICSCARCLRKNGPVTTDMTETIEEIAEYLEDCASELDYELQQQQQAVQALEARVDLAATAARAADCKAKGPQRPAVDEAAVSEGGKAESPRRETAQMLCKALEQGDQAKLRRELCALQAMPDCDQAYDAEEGGAAAGIATLLALPAAQRGLASVIYLLHEFGGTMEKVDLDRGGPPLMHAANNGHASTVTALLKCDADPDAVDYNKQTALMVAVFSDRAKAAEALIANGATVDKVDDKGRTALCHAAKYGSIDCIHILGHHNANAFHEDNEGNNPLQIAEDASRFEATNHIRKLQQRQRLREMRQQRKAEARAVAAVVDADALAEQEAKALELQAELLAEEAAERNKAEAKAAEKAAKKQAKAAKAKKGKSNPTEVILAGAAAESKDAAAAVDSESAQPAQLEDPALPQDLHEAQVQEPDLAETPVQLEAKPRKGRRRPGRQPQPVEMPAGRASQHSSQSDQQQEQQHRPALVREHQPAADLNMNGSGPGRHHTRQEEDDREVEELRKLYSLEEQRQLEEHFAAQQAERRRQAQQPRQPAPAPVQGAPPGARPDAVLPARRGTAAAVPV
eukprot:jgi/Astpho2/2654/Aster-x0544